MQEDAFVSTLSDTTLESLDSKCGPGGQPNPSLTGAEEPTADSATFELLDDLYEESTSNDSQQEVWEGSPDTLAHASKEVARSPWVHPPARRLRLYRAAYVCTWQAVDEDDVWSLFSDDGSLPDPSDCGGCGCIEVSVQGCVHSNACDIYESDDDSATGELPKCPLPASADATGPHSRPASGGLSVRAFFCGCAGRATGTTMPCPDLSSQRGFDGGSWTEWLVAGYPNIVSDHEVPFWPPYQCPWLENKPLTLSACVIIGNRIHRRSDQNTVQVRGTQHTAISTVKEAAEEVAQGMAHSMLGWCTKRCTSRRLPHLRSCELFK